VAAGIVAARQPPAKRWNTAVALLILAMLVRFFADLPMTRAPWRTLLWHCTPLGILCGAAWQHRYGRTALPAARGSSLATAPHTSIPLALGVTAICFGWPVVIALAAAFGGETTGAFNDNNFLALVLTEAVLASVALTVLSARNYPLGTLRPRFTLADAGAGIGLWLATLGACAITLVIAGSGQTSQPVEQLLAEAQVSAPVTVLLSLVNGAYEEVFLLGFLASGLRRFGASNAIAITLLVRLLTHAYQGPLGALSVMVFGAVLGVYFFRSGRLFPVVAAHILADATALLNTGAP
jgi:membrane protease YdiL (CAAX protease family)